MYIIKFFKKASTYGIKGKNLSWFETYLTGRKQYINLEINVNNGKTELLEIICDAPQGSILGPLIFIIYINDLPSMQYLHVDYVSGIANKDAIYKIQI